MDATGVAGKIYDALNEVVERNQSQSEEFVRVADLVGREGRFTQRTAIGGAAGTRAGSTKAFNTPIDDLVQPSTEIARVISAPTCTKPIRHLSINEVLPVATFFTETGGGSNVFDAL